MASAQATQASAEHRRMQLRKGFNKAWQYALNLLLVCLFIFPLLFMLSLKASGAQIFADLRALRAFLPVGELTLDNYIFLTFQRAFVHSVTTPGLEG
jgi:ABC-type glycerol-3-phosphate transport system permease component